MIRFMVAAFMLLYLAACAGTTGRRESIMWSGYAQGAGQIIQQQGDR